MRHGGSPRRNRLAFQLNGYESEFEVRTPRQYAQRLVKASKAGIDICMGLLQLMNCLLRLDGLT